MGASCFCLRADSRIRNFVFVLVQNDQFDAIIIIIILVSTASLTFQNPTYNPNSEWQSFLRVLDAITTYIFCAEAALKIAAYGFYFNGEGSYLKNFDGVFDFIIVVSALLSQHVSSSFRMLSKLKSLRVLRVIRPLRIISRS